MSRIQLAFRDVSGREIFWFRLDEKLEPYIKLSEKSRRDKKRWGDATAISLESSALPEALQSAENCNVLFLKDDDLVQVERSLR